MHNLCFSFDHKKLYLKGILMPNLYFSFDDEKFYFNVCGNYVHCSIKYDFTHVSTAAVSNELMPLNYFKLSKLNQNLVTNK